MSVSRRDFLAGAGALIVSFASTAPRPSGAAARGERVRRGIPASSIRGSAIAADGMRHRVHRQVRARPGDAHRADAAGRRGAVGPVDRVRLVQCDTSLTPDQGTTSGSQSRRRTSTTAIWRWPRRRRARRCCSWRRRAWRLPADQLTIVDGTVRARAMPRDASATASWSAAGSFELPLDPTAKRKPAGDWTVLGTSVRASICRRW